jgi:hypothetical protein
MKTVTTLQLKVLLAYSFDGKIKVKLHQCLTKYHTLKMYPVLK